MSSSSSYHNPNAFQERSAWADRERERREEREREQQRWEAQEDERLERKREREREHQRWEAEQEEKRLQRQREKDEANAKWEAEMEAKRIEKERAQKAKEDAWKVEQELLDQKRLQIEGSMHWCYGNINDIWGDLQRAKGSISKGSNVPSGDWYHQDRVAKGKGKYSAVSSGKGPSGKGWLS